MTIADPHCVPMCHLEAAALGQMAGQTKPRWLSLSVSPVSPRETCRVKRVSQVHLANARSFLCGAAGGRTSVRKHFWVLCPWPRSSQPSLPPISPSTGFTVLFEQTVLSRWPAQCSPQRWPGRRPVSPPRLAEWGSSFQTPISPSPWHLHLLTAASRGTS